MAMKKKCYFLLYKKIVRIIKLFAEQYNVPLREAMDFFYKSDACYMMSRGIADYHCRSDLYIVEDLHNEWLEKQKEQTKTGIID
jgi:hypothetical protein